jgi:hypothetical protein
VRFAEFIRSAEGSGHFPRNPKTRRTRPSDGVRMGPGWERFMDHIFRVSASAAGWQLRDGENLVSIHPTKDQALQTADNLIGEAKRSGKEAVVFVVMGAERSKG